MAIDYDNDAGRRPKASSEHLINLLTRRLLDFRQCVGRIEGIVGRLRELGVRLPCTLPPLPDAQDAIDALMERGYAKGEQDQIDYDTHYYWTANCRPEDRPALSGGTLEEVLCVHAPLEGDDWQMHVEISIQIHPASWGILLRDVARTISAALAEKNDMTREQAEAIIERRFNSGYTFLPTKQVEPSDATEASDA